MWLISVYRSVWSSWPIDGDSSWRLPNYQVDALIRLLDAAATRRRPPCQRYKVAAAGAARDPGSWVAARAGAVGARGRCVQ